MKIFYLALIRLPTEKAHGAQIMKTCEALAEEGVQVELIVPGRKTSIQKDPFNFFGVKRNFIITKLKVPDWIKWGSVGFGLSALWFAELAKWKKSFWKADVIYSRDAFVLLQYVLLGKRLVYEAHTTPTFISMFVAKRVTKLVVISEGLREAYATRGIPKEKIIVAHDAVDPEPFKKHYDQKKSRRWLDIPDDKKIALYVGRIDAAKGADTFAAASELVSAEWQCVLIGAGPLKAELEKRYPKALFLPETPYIELARVLAAGDILVIPNSAKDENAARYTSPLKAFAYLASGKPILASDVPSLRDVLKANAVYFVANNPKECASVLMKSVLSTPAKQSPSVYTWRERAQTVLEGLNV